MSTLRKLYEKAKGSPNNLSFKELCGLAKGAGFITRRKGSGTSHRIFTHPKLTNEAPLNLQSHRRKAKSYQVRMLLDLIDAYGLLEEK